MKIRNGFVSNSSSSSFIIVGICNKSKIQALLKKIGWDSEKDDDWYDRIEEMFNSINHGQYEKDGLIYIWGSEKYPMYVGINPLPFLKADLTLSEIKGRLIKRFDDLGINIQEKDIDIDYGESCSE